MTTYNTGNPVGSVDVRDLYDNAENLDYFSNGTAPAYPDRLGASRKSLAGMEAEFDADQALREEHWEEFLAGAGYQILGPYAAGLQFTAMNQVFSYLGEFYAPSAGVVLPYTTTGVGAVEIANFRSVGDAILRQDLADDTDPAPGATLVGYDSDTVKGFLDRLRAVDDIAKGAGLVGFHNRTVHARLVEQKSIYDFFIPGQVDWTLAFANAAAYLKGFPGIPPELVFPSGIFEYSESPNWAVQFGKITGSGSTRLRYTGTGDGVTIDGNDYPAMNGVFCMDMRGFIYEGPSNSLNGFKLSATHHCDFGFRVDGCGIASAGIDVNFAACTKFHRPEVSVNAAGGWYVGANMVAAKPLHGMRLNGRDAGEQVAYCYIDNPIIEGTENGVTGIEMLGTTIAKGTLEGCTGIGLILGAGCLRNVIDHVDFEVNAGADIYCNGSANKFTDIDSDGIVVIDTGAFNRLTGGNFNDIVIGAGTERTILSELVYNRTGAGGTLTDNGVRTRKRDIQDASDGYVHDAIADTVGVAVVSPTTTWVNTTGNPVHFYVVGGVVTQITRKRGSGPVVSTGVTHGETYLAAGDTIGVTMSDSTGLNLYYMTA